MVKRKAFLTFLSLFLIVSLSTTVLADPSLNDLEKAKANEEQRINENTNKLSDEQNKVNKLSMDIEKLDNQMEKLFRDIADNKKQIELVQAQIKNSEKDIKKAEDDIKDEQELFDKRIRNMYMNGTGGYLDVILESKGFSDFLTRVEAVKVIVEYDKRVINDLKSKKNNIVKQKEALDEKNKRLSALKADNETKLSELNKSKQKQKDAIASLDKSIKDLNKAIANSNSKVGDLNTQIENAKRPMETGGSGGSSIGGKEVYTGSNPIVAFAYKFQGYKYVWGGKGPTNFDCSGFMWYVYNHFGYQIGGWTGEQKYAGIAVGRGELKEGDLIFFGDDFDSIHHVGMYVGNNRYIHAPRTGDVIKISSLGGRNDYVCARRIIR